MTARQTAVKAIHEDNLNLRNPSILAKLLDDYAKEQLKEGAMPVVSNQGELFENMQYYMEYCKMTGYVTPQDWLKTHKHF